MSGSGEIYRYSDASGHRAAYGSYFGFWYINWPLGQAATVSLTPHVSHSSSMDVYPRKFVRRVDRCIRTTAGITTSQDAKSFQSGFSVRKPPGAWILQYQQKSFSGAHGSRHLYYLVGGKVSEVDFLMLGNSKRIFRPTAYDFSLPSLEFFLQATLFEPEKERRILDHALDCLPWSSLSWSVHRGLRDILIDSAQSTMNNYRKDLASRLHAAVGANKHRLQTLGWFAEFVDESMNDIAFNAIMAGEGNSFGYGPSCHRYCTSSLSIVKHARPG